MSLLSIATAVCNTAPVAAPGAIVGDSNSTAVLLYALANQAGQSLARRPQGGWITMIREFDFTTNAIASQSGSIDNTGSNGNALITGLANTTGIAAADWIASGTNLPMNAVVVAVTSTTVEVNVPCTSAGGGNYTFAQVNYALPADFQRPIDNTFWDRTRYWSMRGPQSPQQWQVYKSSVIGSASVQRRFRFRASNVIYGTGGTPGTSVLSIDPTPFDDGARLVFEYVSNAWCQSATGTLQTQWGADTDTGILDEYLLQLGLQWRFLRRLGLSYNEELDDYEREVDKAVAQDGGAPVLSLVPSATPWLVGPWGIPESGFGGDQGFTIGVSDIGGPMGIG